VLLILALTYAMSGASSHIPQSSNLSRTRRRRSNTKDRTLPKSSSSIHKQKKGRKRRKKRKPTVRDPVLVDTEDVFSDFVALDFEQDENEERILSALDKLTKEDSDELRTYSDVSLRKEHSNCQPSKPATATFVQHKEPSSSLTPNANETVNATPQKQQQEQWISDNRKIVNEPRQRSAFLPTSYTRPQPHTSGPTQVQQVYKGSAQFIHPSQAASVQQQNPIGPQTVSLFPPTTPWIRKFLSSRPKDSLLPIPREYLADGFNLVQLPLIVEIVGLGTTNIPTTTAFPLYKAALRLILQEHEEPTQVPPDVQRAAECLYILVHARYIISPRGLETVRRVLREQPIFGRCPRTTCRGMPVLPYCETSDYEMCMAKSYCCNCGETFTNWDSKTDGAAWGPSFCNLLLMTYGKEFMQDLYRLQIPPSSVEENLVTPSIFGFKVHAASILARQPDVF